MEHKRRLKLQLYEIEYERSSESSDMSYRSNVHEEEVLRLEESDTNVNMQNQEQLEQEQMEDDSLSEGNILVDNNIDIDNNVGNNIDWSLENTRHSMKDITDSVK